MDVCDKSIYETKEQKFFNSLYQFSYKDALWGFFFGWTQ